MAVLADVDGTSLQHQPVLLDGYLFPDKFVEVLSAELAHFGDVSDERVLAFGFTEQIFDSLNLRRDNPDVVVLIEQLEIHESVLLYDLVTTLENLLLSVLKMDHVGDEILREDTTIVDGLHPMQMLVLFD